MRFTLRIIQDESVKTNDRLYKCLHCQARFERTGIAMHNSQCPIRIEDDAINRNIIVYVGPSSPEWQNAERITFDAWCDLMKIRFPFKEVLYYHAAQKVVDETTRNSIPFWRDCVAELMARNK